MAPQTTLKPNQITISGILFHTDLAPLAGAVIKMRLNRTGFYHKGFVPIGEGVEVTTDINGHYSFTLLTTDMFTVDAKYHLQISLDGRFLYDALVYVPSFKPIFGIEELVNAESLNNKSFDLFPIARNTVILPRLSPKYWTADGTISQVSSIVTTGTNSFRVETVHRKKQDYTAVFWSSKDTLSHRLLAYLEDKDYSKLVWTFDVALSDGFAPIEDPNKGLALTIRSTDSAGNTVDKYIRLKDHTTDTGRTAHVSIDFGNVFDGITKIDVSDTDELFFTLYGDQYSQTDSAYLNTEFYGSLDINNSVVSGLGSSMYVSNITVPAHDLGMCTAYDDNYNQTPQRIIENTLTLGYRDWINHYVGMSHYWNVNLSPSGVTLNTTPGQEVNRAATAWHKSLFHHAQVNGFKVVNSISYEIFSTVIPLEWCMREWDGTLGYTGYTPPSYLVSPSSTAGMTFLSSAMVNVAQLAAGQGLEPYIQIGEPWWWLNQNGNPCFYDAATKAQYKADTGFDAPFIRNVRLTPAESSQADIARFMTWLRTKLGDCNQAIRQRVKASVPAAKVSILFFLPSILDPYVGILNYVNYPSEAYSYPNYDFMQTECYDWVTSGYLGADRAERGYTSALNELKYPPALCQYLAGFAPLPSIQNWTYIFQSVRNGDKYGIGKVYIWAYPFVMRDSITYLNHSTVFYFNQQEVQIFRGQTTAPQAS
ncbi:carboxypeptidase-like regulatory domain-containing protein (plasmid) [Deinococcus radiomollis]|uniref:carboxypeptidase-like regulatory domain-containing protein n=1 Tax=Deinococcus radiomollis TaxID=468916 RepID=UPI0038919DBD